MRLVDVIERLRSRYGTPVADAPGTPWQMILHKNCAYLVDDDRRAATWKAFKKMVGVKLLPEKILGVDPATLAEAIRGGGMQPERRAEKLRSCALIAIERFKGDLDGIFPKPRDVEKAAANAKLIKKLRGAIKKFPSIGDPSADRIMCCMRLQAVLPLDSNGLRVLLRLGYGSASGNYGSMYKSVQAALAGELPDPPDYEWLMLASRLLRMHGRELCTRKLPRCERCPVAKVCPSRGTPGEVAE